MTTFAVSMLNVPPSLIASRAIDRRAVSQTSPSAGE
jgi:hypothetical protein